MPPESLARYSFARRVVDWQRRFGRHALPWQGTRDAYRIWLSEVMLQQTQVSVVLAYYARFLERFPDVAALAAAPIDEVLSLWSGLGYYSRARNLHACAQAVVARHDGVFPRSAGLLATLPGIGESTAAAIAAFSAGERVAILDGNVKRVLARHRGIEGWPGQPAVAARLWSAARAALPDAGAGSIEAYTQGLMDLGATVCTRARPACDACPVSADCLALAGARTADLPTPKPRAQQRVRRASMLVMRHGDAVWLETRPPSGIWGGLASLPQFDDEAALMAQAAAWAPGVEPVALSPRRHVFTHFALDFVPWLLAVDERPALAGIAGRWVAPDAIARAALPAPIRTLLLALAASREAVQSTFF